MKKVIISIIVILLIGTGVYFIFNGKAGNPESALKEYFSKISEQKYEDLYDLLDEESKTKITKDNFVTRNSKIFDGIDLVSIEIITKNISFESSKKAKITYEEIMKLEAGNISFENTAYLNKNQDDIYKINWTSNLIFPNLNDEDKVKVSSSKAKRGSILDRNGVVLAENGKASSVGIVPAKFKENKDQNISKVSELLNTTTDAINNKLNASWVKDDTFVPIKTVSLNETELKEKLLQIPGIKITSVDARTYPLGKSAAHITGYIQTITKEELEKRNGYSTTSLIGKTGLERKYEERLKGKDGIEVYIEDSQGNKKETITKQEKIDGENIKLTIDSRIQKNLYNELKKDEGLFVVMNYETGEILALVSTPSYDVNKMTLGMSTSEWNELQENEHTPMLSRFQQSYCPGSTFKALTGAIGLSTGKLSEDDTFNYSGLSWQKDKSWGDFNVTTLTAYSGPKNLKNALIHSDNIYFAQAALKIGKDTLVDRLKKIKFNESIDFDLNLSKSQYANSDTIKSEGALANSGYGQGEVLVNPVHMASVYSAFVNEGNMVKPYIEYKEDKQKEYLVENAFTENAANTIKEDLIQVVENPEGTAKDMKINGITIAGKTGTAELKATKEEKADTIGWFDCFTLDYDEPILVVGMVEEANKNGGSHYLIPMIRRLFIK